MMSMHPQAQMVEDRLLIHLWNHSHRDTLPLEPLCAPENPTPVESINMIH